LMSFFICSRPMGPRWGWKNIAGKIYD
jgi:hypothetical protein